MTDRGKYTPLFDRVIILRPYHPMVNHEVHPLMIGGQDVACPEQVDSIVFRWKVEGHSVKGHVVEHAQDDAEPWLAALWAA